MANDKDIDWMAVVEFLQGRSKEHGERAINHAANPAMTPIFITSTILANITADFAEALLWGCNAATEEKHMPKRDP